MRPTDRSSGAVWRLLKQWQADEAERSPWGRGPTQSDMARLFKVSTSLISSWKYKESVLQPDDAIRIAESTGIPLDELFHAVSQDNPDVQQHIALRRSTNHPPRGPRQQDAD